MKRKNKNPESGALGVKLLTTIKEFSFLGMSEERLTQLCGGLLDEGADPDITCAGKTSLLHAAERRLDSIMLLLVAAGADVNITGPEGETALHKAIRHQKRASVTLLLEAGADLDIKNDKGESPWDMVMRMKAPPLRKLVENHAMARINKAAHKGLRRKQHSAPLPGMKKISLSDAFRQTTEKTQLEGLPKIAKKPFPGKTGPA